MKLLRGLCFYLTITLGAITSFMLLSPTIFLIFAHSVRLIKWKRIYINFVSGLFFSYSAFILRYICGTKILIYSENPDIVNDENIGLIISNHRCRLDWLYVGWFYAVICNLGSYLKVVMKDSLRSIPIFGWSAQLMLSIFLSRKKEADIPYIKRAFSYILHADKKAVFLLFPEGTDLSSGNLERSIAFSKEKGLREYSQVLYPKPAGFITCLRLLKNQSLSLHDLTVAYKGYTNKKRPTEKDFMYGIFPREVHIHVKKYKIDDLSDDRALLENWLHALFLQKEEMLLNFDKTGSLSNNQNVNIVEYSHNYLQSTKIMIFLMIILLISCISFSWLRWLFVILIILSVGSRAFNGIDSIELALHGSMFISEMKRRNSSSGNLKLD